MLLEAGRDTAAMFFLDGRLGALRESHLEMVLAGDTPSDDFWQEGEARAVDAVKERFFTAGVQDAVQAGGTDGPPHDGSGDRRDENFDAHSQKLVERGIWLAHEKLKSIPFVGHPDYAAS